MKTDFAISGNLHKDLKISKTWFKTYVKDTDVEGLTFTRKFTMPSWCHNPETLLIPLAHAYSLIKEAGEAGLPRPPRSENFAAVARLYGLGESETYAVYPELLTAIDNTDFSSDTFSFEALEWPMASFMLCLPKGNTVGAGGEEISFLLITNTSIIENTDQESQGDSFGMAFYDVDNQINASYTASLGEFKGTELPEIIAGNTYDPQLAKLIILALKFVVFFNVVTGPYEEGRLLGKLKVKRSRKKSLTEFWSPKHLGRTFAISAKRASHSSSSSKRFHWRRGHYRNHACGKGKLDRKLIWLKPVRINADQQVA